MAWGTTRLAGIYVPLFLGPGRLGRCVRADPAAVFAALLDLGLRSTLDAAEAARLLVTSLFPVRLAICFFLNLMIARLFPYIYCGEIIQ